MSQQLTPFSISAPGFFGLNTSDSPVDLSANFALTAINCVIDKAGRIGSRKGWIAQNTTNSDLSTSDVTCIGECIENGGTSTLVCTGGAFIFKVSSGTMTTLTYGGGGAAPTISAANWKFCQLNGVAIFWQRGYDPLIYDPAVSTTQFRRLSEKSGSTGTVQQANEAISAFGRIWCADLTANKNTVYFSDLLTPHIWTGGTSGSLDLIGIWPKGGDEIVALAAHNNFLYIFGKFQTLVYSGADNPATMQLHDTISGIGCIARDSVQNTGEDIVFLANDGVRSLQRTIQEKSAPMRTVSQNVNRDVLDYVASAAAGTIRAVYSPADTFYVLSFPTSSIAYCFDMRVPLENGASRATTWSLIPKAQYAAKDGSLYFGFAGYVGKYSGYIDRTSTYRMSYYTTWIDFAPEVLISILKKILVTMKGLSGQSVVLKWGYDYVQNYTSESTSLMTTGSVSEWGLAEWGIGEWQDGLGGIQRVSVNGSGSGKVVQFGFEATVNNAQISIQRIDLYAKTGRLQ